MKSIKLALIAASTVFAVSAYSQTDSTSQDSSAAAMPATTYGQPATDSMQANTPAKLLVTPNFGPHYIAVLGNYTSSPETSKTEKNVTISGDEQNPGKIWIEGLTDSKIYALRKEMAGTYKIPAQKADEKNIAEGTVVYDDNNKQINICVGCKYKDENPAEAFTGNSSGEVTTGVAEKKKVKTATAKTIHFTGSKTDAGTASVNK